MDNAVDSAGLPPSLEPLVLAWLERIGVQDETAPGWLAERPGERRVLLRLVASSDFAGRVLARDWGWFRRSIEFSDFSTPPLKAATVALDEALHDVDDEVAIKARLRRFRNRQLVHILWRSMAGTADLAETLASLSTLADCLIDTAVRCAGRLLAGRFGEVRNAAGEAMPLVVLAMGKLGGGELNFSSDVDLIFLYPEDGETDGRRTQSAHEYFVRKARRTVALLDEVTADGFVYRVDTRLRPFGDSGPPVASFAALESYLLQHGRDWERYAYVKARVVSPASSEPAVRELMSDIIQPFVYRRYLDFGVFESLRDMKALIENEVRKRELKANIKLGPGGIREIEFIVQSLQLVRGGGDAELRQPALGVVLPRLAHGRGLSSPAADSLVAAYDYLRRVENAVQAIHDRQTHDVPADELDQQRLVVALGEDSWAALKETLDRHRQEVARHFAALLFARDDDNDQPGIVRDVTGLWDGEADEDRWRAMLETHGFAGAAPLADTLYRFAHTTVPRRIDTTAARRLRRFMPALLGELKDRKRPNLVLERVLKVVEQILRRSAYVSLLNENPAVLARLVGLCENSRYLAQEIARYPLLLDELLDPRIHSAGVTKGELEDDLASRWQQLTSGDSEGAIEVLGQFQRASLFRVAVADHAGNLPIMKVSDRLTDLAELVLERALDLAWRDLTGTHGTPVIRTADGEREAGLAVIAYGKLGGMELSYQSDLDLVFLHDSSGDQQHTTGDKPLENSMFFARLVRRLIHFLTTQTGSGALYEVDTRLRPSGRSGLLVSSVEGFERYQEENAWTWEHQALLRSRPVAGSGAIAREFERIRAETLRFRVHSEQLLEDVLSMRARMRDQLDKSDADSFDLKQGAGGIGDIEFIVQYLVLKNAEAQPAVIHYPDNIRQLGTLGATGCLPQADVARLQETYRTYRHRLHRLALDERPPQVDAGDFVDERDFVRSVWARELA